MKIWDFIYKYFWWFGKAVLRIYPNLPENIRRSGMSVYPEAYASLIGFVTILSSIISVSLTLSLIFLGFLSPLLSIIVTIPFISFILMVYLPHLIGAGRGGAIDGEIPYMTAYLSVMVTSGVSPYDAFERISKSKAVFPKSSDLSQRFVLLVRVLGRDPLTAFSMLARRTPSPTANDLLTGYITTVRSGGDVGDYLTKKARLLFSEILVKMKIIADKLAGLLEAYLAMILLTTIALSTMYFVTTSLYAAVTFGLSATGMFIMLYILMPFLSLMIIYITDLTQYREPWIDYRPYIVYGGISIPLIIFLIVFSLVIPSALPSGHPFRENILVKIISSIVLFPTNYVHIEDYLRSSLIFIMSFIFGTISAALYAEYVSHEYKVVYGITKFLRDLVEIRKTGLSPERSIIELSRRNYGVFTKYLKKISLQLSLGIPLSKIINDILKKVIVWRAKVLLYMMTDAIEVGGGTIAVLENLAWFAESIDTIEEEKKKSLRILLIVPYMGAILTILTIILLTVFMGALTVKIAAYRSAANLTLPAIILNIYLMGLVAGKVSAGSIAAGFKHALVLMLISLATILAAPLIKAALTGTMAIGV